MRIFLIFLVLSNFSMAQELIPQISVFSPSRLVLEPVSGQSEFQDTISGIPLISLNLSQALGTRESFQFSLREKLTYLYKQFLTSNQNIVHLNGVNLEGLLDIRYQTSFAFDPGFSFGLGSLFLQETSEGKERAMWVPQVSFGPVFRLSTYDATKTDAFTGVSFSLLYTHSIFTTYAYEGLIVTVGAHFLL